MDEHLQKLNRTWLDSGSHEDAERYALGLIRADMSFKLPGVTFNNENSEIIPKIVDDFLESTDRLASILNTVKLMLEEDVDYLPDRIRDAPFELHKLHHIVLAHRAYDSGRIFIRIWLPSRDGILWSGNMHDARIVVSGDERERPDVIESLEERLPWIPSCSNLIETEVLTQRGIARHTVSPAIGKSSTGRIIVHSRWNHFRCNVDPRQPRPKDLLLSSLPKGELELLTAPPTFEELAKMPGKNVVPFDGSHHYQFQNPWFS